jgi:uncharacterized OB-fold protein
MSEFLLPDLDDNEALLFWEGCAQGELRVQRCADCRHVTHPPRPMCPRCRSIDREWVATSGRGRTWSYVVAHPPLLPAYSPLAPYNVVVVELDDPDVAAGSTVRFVGNLVAGPEAEINSIDPSTIAIGEPVRVVFATIDDVTLPRWVRV